MSENNTSPAQHLAVAASLYPDIWKKIDASRNTEAWPDWCFMPVACVATLISPEWRGRRDLHNMAKDAALIAGLAAWRVTQGIYRFDSGLYAALITTSINRLPAEVLTLLPEWGVYVETQHDAGIKGFFAHCEWDHRTRSPELRLLLDRGYELIPMAIPLRDGTLSESVSSVIPVTDKPFADMWAPAVSLLLYICSVAADFGHYTAKRPEPVKTKRGMRLFPPDKPTVVETGKAVGSVLRASQHSDLRSESVPGERRVAPHVRRAHWHGYWSGTPKKLAVRWMHPILVNTTDPCEYVRTVK